MAASQSSKKLVKFIHERGTFPTNVKVVFVADSHLRNHHGKIEEKICDTITAPRFSHPPIFNCEGGRWITPLLVEEILEDVNSRHG